MKTLEIRDKTAREAILGNIRKAPRRDEPMSARLVFPYPGDAVENFLDMLRSFDGTVVLQPTREDAIVWLKDNIDPQARVFSSVEAYPGTVTASELADPHAAIGVDVAVGEGLLGVGETGSVWVTRESLGIPAGALLCGTLFLLLDRSRIVGDLHEAYDLADLQAAGYGSFFTGPSATADIEAVRVVGAQGPGVLTVVLYG